MTKFCKDCGKEHKKDEKEEYIEEKEVVREPYPYDRAPSEDKKSNKCAECGKEVQKVDPRNKNEGIKAINFEISEAKRSLSKLMRSMNLIKDAVEYYQLVVDKPYQLDVAQLIKALQDFSIKLTKLRAK